MHVSVWFCIFFLCVYEFQQRTDFCNDLYDKKQIVKKKKKKAGSTAVYNVVQSARSSKRT